MRNHHKLQNGTRIILHISLPCDRKLGLELWMKLSMRGELVCFHVTCVFHALTTLFDCCVRRRHETLVESATSTVTRPCEQRPCQSILDDTDVINYFEVFCCMIWCWVLSISCSVNVLNPTPLPSLQEPCRLSFSVRQTVVSWDTPANCTIIQTKVSLLWLIKNEVSSGGYNFIFHFWMWS